MERKNKLSGHAVVVFKTAGRLYERGAKEAGTSGCFQAAAQRTAQAPSTAN